MPDDEYPTYEPDDLPWELQEQELPPDAQGVVWHVVIEHHVQPVSATAMNHRSHSPRIEEPEEAFERREDALAHARRLAYEFVPPRLGKLSVRRIYQDREGFLVVLDDDKRDDTHHFTARAVRFIGAVDTSE